MQLRPRRAIWGKEASAASFFLKMVPGLQIDLRGRNRIYNTISNNKDHVVNLSVRQFHENLDLQPLKQSGYYEAPYLGIASIRREMKISQLSPSHFRGRFY